ncbi:MAG: SDR family oxidoreductase [Symploca sp. SIO1C4]|uniref:SDR family oxidoreductase n=1 Tax=Symploca sp. SIO1C4 TaxID=2607765 RepID=A0A6B3NIK0_9CYAN|nr:SDR family oxidoreductase [Symploca sp. SIO1C4]
MRHPILITGSNRGLGLEIAKLLNKASVPLVVSSRNPKKNESTLNSLGIYPQLNLRLDFDISDPADVDKVLNQLPSLSGAVHCASPYTLSQLTNASLDEFQLYGNFFQNNFIFGKHVLNSVRAGKGGRIILIGSTAADVGRTKTSLTIYGIYKNSLKALAEGITNEGKAYNVSSTYITLGGFRDDSDSGVDTSKFLKQSSVAEMVCHILQMKQDIRMDYFELTAMNI